MSKDIRQGLGLALIGLAVTLVGLVAADGQAGRVLASGGFLFLVGGLVATAVAFFRSPQQD